jgi:hypothetical protein
MNPNSLHVNPVVAEPLGQNHAPEAPVVTI